MTGQTRHLLESRDGVPSRVKTTLYDATHRCVCLTGDDAAVLSAVASVLTVAGYDVRRFAAPAELLSASQELPPGVVVISSESAAPNSLDHQIALIHRLASFRVILLAAFPRASFVVAAMKAGAVTVLDRPLDPEVLLAAVAEGFAQIDQATVLEEADASLPPVIPHGQSYLDRLSERERDVMQLVFEGATNKSIGIRLGISIKTVEKHRGRAMKKLEVCSLAGLIRLMDREQGMNAAPARPEGAA